MKTDIDQRESEIHVQTIHIARSTVPEVVIKDIEDFVIMVQSQNPKTLFWDVDDKLDGKAAMLIAGVMFSTEVRGYENFDELIAGFVLGFDKGFEYRHAMTIGAGSYTEYAAFVTSGYPDLEEYRKVLATDLAAAYHVWIKHYESLLPNSEKPEVSNLYEFDKNEILSDLGFPELEQKQITRTFEAGFLRHTDFLSAKKLGFTDAKSYFKAMRYEITSPTEYKELQLSGIESKSHWLLYKEETQQAREEGFTNILGKVLFKIYSSGTIDSTWIITEIQRQIEQLIIRKYQMINGYCVEIARSSELKAFTALTMHPDIRQLVVISADHIQVIRRKLEPKETATANLDLCNIVLHGFLGEPDERVGDVSKALAVIERLRSFGVKTINVFADATHTYYLTKPEIKKVKDAADLFVPVKKGFSADAYMLDYAQNNPSFIVTNDQFSEHRSEKNPWIFQNIPRILVGYEFDGEGQIRFKNSEYELHQMS
jgi:hypothetical protein